MENIKRGMLICMMTFAFWGVLYPQFSLVDESYEVTNKDKNPREDFFSILEADKGEVIITSKFLEMWKAKQKTKIEWSDMLYGKNESEGFAHWYI